MSIALATMGKFLPKIHVGGAILYQHQESERLRLNINVLSMKSTDKQPSPLKITLKCR
jgi:hypothetical protein